VPHKGEAKINEGAYAEIMKPTKILSAPITREYKGIIVISIPTFTE
jgi:hypothetical protein